LDICFQFGIAIGSFYSENGVIWGMIDALDHALLIEFPFHDANKLQQISEGFQKCSSNKMSNCVLAVDGWVCRTRQPHSSEVLFPSAYRNRKDCFGIVIIAGCDSKTRFLMFSCISSGSTHDALAWMFSQMKHDLDLGILPFQYYFVGDEAFMNTNQFLVPWSGHNLDSWKDSFNYHLSSMRQCIERAFGILTQRWGIFWRPLQFNCDKWPLVCMVAAKLHNFCIDMNEGEERDIMARLRRDIQEDDFPWVILNETPMDEGFILRPTGDRRRDITSSFERDGIYRPNRNKRRI
jgi:hypothetical protein